MLLRHFLLARLSSDLVRIGHDHSASLWLRRHLRVSVCHQEADVRDELANLRLLLEKANLSSVSHVVRLRQLIQIEGTATN